MAQTGHAIDASPPAVSGERPALHVSTAPSGSAVSSLPIIAPVLSLPNLALSQVALWNSNEVKGDHSVVLLILGQTRNAQIASLAHDLTPSSPSSPARVLVSANKLQLSTLRPVNATGAPLLLIDRVGWLRRVEKVESADQLTSRLKVLEEIGDPTPQLEAGKPAPDFALRDANGVLRRVSDLKGRKNLLLTFFPRCFTFTCKAQLSSINDAKADLQKNDVEVWAVSVDAADGERGQRAYAKYLKAWFPFLPDTGRNLCLLYDAVKSPNQIAARMSVFIGKDGIVKWIDKQINPKTHGADVVAKMISEKSFDARNEKQDHE